MVAMGEERDWLQVVCEQTCEECGLASMAVPRDALGTAVREEADHWVDLLTRYDVGELRHSPRPGTWSALEYAGHVCDVLALFGSRITRTLSEDEPDFPWWDHKAAAVEDRYNEQDPAHVAARLQANAHQLGLALLPAADRGWERMATRRGRERFTVDTLARFALHEARHHRWDAERGLIPSTPPG